MRQTTAYLWSMRILILAVFIFNLQCAVVFLFKPERFAPSFELSGLPGTLVVQGFGILFLMWVIPYIFATLHPIRNFISLMEACLMQIVAGAGETILYIRLDETHSIIKDSLGRFMVFDWGGVVLLGIAFLLARHIRTKFDKDALAREKK